MQKYLSLRLIALKSKGQQFTSWVWAKRKKIITVIGVFILPWLLQVTLIQIRLFRSFEDNNANAEKIAQAKVTLEKELSKLDRKLNAKLPKSHYLIINSASNYFSLYKGNTLVKKDKCSTGSYVLLKKGDHQQWMFKTPKGEFRILGKTTSPVWKKPDWAFVEEGLPVPPINDQSRYEYGVLGDYALSLGDGYLIHGTLYQRFLGMPVTHGCIRLNDENLKLVFHALSYGSKVYIY